MMSPVCFVFLKICRFFIIFFLLIEQVLFLSAHFPYLFKGNVQLLGTHRKYLGGFSLLNVDTRSGFLAGKERGIY